MAVITVQGLTKRFGDVLAVDELSFEVDQGTVVGFLGPNGTFTFVGFSYPPRTHRRSPWSRARRASGRRSRSASPAAARP